MKRRVLVNVGWLLAAAVAVGAAGCVERRYTILTDPPGAIVLENGKPVGPAPVTRPFTYYGDTVFTIIRDGYQTLKVRQPIRAPWYQYFPLDFIAENLIPWTLHDNHVWIYNLQPVQVEPPEAVYNRAEQLRQQGHAVGVPPTALLPPGAVPPGQPPAQVLPPADIPQVQPLPPAR
jgi:hypothetical protein